MTSEPPDPPHTSVAFISTDSRAALSAQSGRDRRNHVSKVNASVRGTGLGTGVHCIFGMQHGFVRIFEFHFDRETVRERLGAITY